MFAIKTSKGQVLRTQAAEGGTLKHSSRKKKDPVKPRLIHQKRMQRTLRRLCIDQRPTLISKTERVAGGHGLILESNTRQSTPPTALTRYITQTRRHHPGTQNTLCQLASSLVRIRKHQNSKRVHTTCVAHPTKHLIRSKHAEYTATS